MRTVIFPVLLTLAPVGAIAQETVPYGTIEYGILEPGTALPHTVPLASGEEVIGVYSTAPIIRIPAEGGIVYETIPYEPPGQDIDRVTGLPRNTTGWTGESSEPAGIGCFPQGVCAHLN